MTTTPNYCRGRIKFFDYLKGYGFIRPVPAAATSVSIRSDNNNNNNNSSDDVFLQSSTLVGSCSCRRRAVEFGKTTATSIPNYRKLLLLHILKEGVLIKGDLVDYVPILKPDGRIEASHVVKVTSAAAESDNHDLDEDAPSNQHDTHNDTDAIIRNDGDDDDSEDDAFVSIHQQTCQDGAGDDSGEDARTHSDYNVCQTDNTDSSPMIDHGDDEHDEIPDHDEVKRQKGKAALATAIRRHYEEEAAAAALDPFSDNFDPSFSYGHHEMSFGVDPLDWIFTDHKKIAARERRMLRELQREMHKTKR